ncbi:MAG: hypothetical protein AB7O21_20380 [Gammaproteobacteria bacterium]
MRSRHHARARTAGAAALLLAVTVEAADTTLVFGATGGVSFDILGTQNNTRFEFSTGDSLVARVRTGASIGGITGASNALVFPEVTVLGQTLIPEVRADTRTGLKLTTAIDAYAGVEFTAGFDTGGGSITGHYSLGPRLTLPSQVRAGEFFTTRGETFVNSAGVALDVGLPSLDLGMDVVLGGGVNGAIEYGLFPLIGYDIGRFNFNLPDIRLPVFDLGINLDLPALPSFSFLDIPNLIPPSQQDDALFRKRLPAVDPLQPAGPGKLISYGEVVLVNPAASATSSGPVVDGNAVVTRTSGDLLRLGLDLDGLATFATTGVSFTGLEFDIKPGTVSLATLSYDLIDVKYGLEVGYEVENRVDTFLEVDIDFVDAASGELVDVMMRDANGISIGSNFAGRFDDLPDLALLGGSDVEMRIDFTGLKRQLSQKGSLTLSDYMELKALAARASVLGGLASLEVGPLYYQKLELGGEFANLDVYDISLTLDDLGLIDGLFDGVALIDALPSLDAYIGHAAPGESAFGALAASEFTLLSNHQSASGTATTDLVLAIASGSPATRARSDLAGVRYHLLDAVDQQVAGVYLAPGSQLVAGIGAAQNLTLRTSSIENHGLITALPFGVSQNATLQLFGIGTDGPLSIRGDGEILIGNSGEIEAGSILNGRGHTLTYAQNNFAAAPGGNRRRLIGSFQITNQGVLRTIGGGALNATTPRFVNEAGATVTVAGGTQLSLTPFSGSATTARLVNQGLIEVSGTGSIFQSLLPTIQGVSLDADGDAPGYGEFHASDNGVIELTNGSAPDLKLNGALRFLADSGGKVDFRDEIVLGTGDLQLITEVGGSVTLNGLQREFENARVRIENAGVLFLESGITSLRASGPLCPGCPPAAPAIRPIDLVNTGTVIVQPGAGFAFDVDIVDYAEGGASFAAGTWQLNGFHAFFDNTSDVDIADRRADVAVVDVRVKEVFGNADRFTDLTFDAEVDPDTGEVVAVTSDIGALDTRLVYNDSAVFLSGAVKFDYFNTVEVNRGTLSLTNGHQFHTASGYENRGGSTVVDTGGGLHVAGALIVNGGEVRIGQTTAASLTPKYSRLTVAGALLEAPDGALVERSVVVDGGTLHFGPVAHLGLGAQPLMGASSNNGLNLLAGHSWLVRDSVTGEAGSEIIVPGLIELRTRGGLLAPGNNFAAGVSEIHESAADVVLDGSEARFEGLEYLVRNRGSLTLLGGAVFERADSSVIAGNDFHNHAGALLDVANGQFRIGGTTSGHVLNAGAIAIGAGGYFEAGSIGRGDEGSGTLKVAGVMNVAGAITAKDVTLDHGSILASSLILSGSPGANGFTQFLVTTTLSGRAGEDAGVLRMRGGTLGDLPVFAPGGRGGNGVADPILFAVGNGGNGGRGGVLEIAGGEAGTAAGVDLRGGAGGAGGTGNPAGGRGGNGGIGGDVNVDGGVLRVDGLLDLRGGAGGRGGNGVGGGLTASPGGRGGNGGRGGQVALRGGEMQLTDGLVDLRGGVAGAGGDGAVHTIFGTTLIGADGANGSAGAEGTLTVAGGTLTTTANAFDTAIQGNVVFDTGTLRFSDAEFALGDASTRLNALVGDTHKTVGAGRALVFDHVLEIGAGISLDLAGGTLRAGALAVAEDFVFDSGLLSVDTLDGSLHQLGGTLAPGQSPGLITIEGDYQFDAGTLALEIAGLARGVEYDAVDVAGTATLGGRLEVSLLDGFLPGAGARFELLSAETILGTFDLVLLAALPDAWQWELDFVLDPLARDAIYLTAAAPVPLPPAAWLMLSTIVVLGGVRRRR